MNYIDLLEANSLIQKIEFKGKMYGEVTERVKAFRYVYPQGTIETEATIIGEEIGTRICICKAKVFNENGYLLSTGTAEEKEGSSFINKTSFVENCETSAVGRALSFAGFSIGTTIMSYEEISNADLNQELLEPITKVNLNVLQGLIKQCQERKLAYESILKENNVTNLEDLNKGQYGKILLGFKDIMKESDK